MNTAILSKCLEELGKEAPNIDYIKGMLETFIVLTGGQPVINNAKENDITTRVKELVSGQEDIPGYLKPGPIGRISEN